MRPLHQLYTSVRLLTGSRRVVLILSRNLDIILDLTIHVVLIYDDLNYSQLVYDSVIKPFYKNNEDTINNFSKHL